jgi:hypothetical protein
MPKNKRQDRDRKPKYQQDEEQLKEEKAVGGLGKSILLLVEGDTEKVYFEKLKQNSWLNNSLAGVMVEVVGNLGTATKKAEAHNDAAQIWIVADNDKRNAFVLEQRGIPFFRNLSNEQLPEAIKNNLQTAYDGDLHNYFLSIYDYLQWLNTAIGSAETIEFWDKIQHFTPIKNHEFEAFDKKYIQQNKGKIQLAYACIAFEFWLILHFEQNNKPFLWVDKDKSENIDVITYFKTIRPNYEKGETKYNAYTCLYDNLEEVHQTIQNEWEVLRRIFTAYKNVKWLHNTMLPSLNRQSGKWYEVNPYILGMDNLIAELLNIKPLGQPIDYFGLTLELDFDSSTCQLQLRIAVNDGEAFRITESQKSCFEIKNREQNSFYPSIEESIELPNQNQPVVLQYAIPETEKTDLVLIINDPRQRSKSSQLFVLLS